MNETSTVNLMKRHELNPAGLSTMVSGTHEGHVLLMEKGFGRVARLENVRGVGNQWRHRYLKFDGENKELILEHPDSDQQKRQRFKVIPDHNKINDNTTDRRFLFEIQGTKIFSIELRIFDKKILQKKFCRRKCLELTIHLSCSLST